MWFVWVSTLDLLRQLLSYWGFSSNRIIIHSKLNIIEKYQEHVWVSLTWTGHFQLWTPLYSQNLNLHQDLQYWSECWSLLFVLPQSRDCTDLSNGTLAAPHENQLQLVMKEMEGKRGRRKKGEEEQEGKEEMERERAANQTHLDEDTHKKTKKSGRESRLKKKQKEM